MTEMERIELAQADLWKAQTRLADTVNAIRALPEDSGGADHSLADALDRRTTDLMAAWTGHQAALKAS
jgi:hypothetical protein